MIIRRNLVIKINNERNEKWCVENVFAFLYLSMDLVYLKQFLYYQLKYKRKHKISILRMGP